jgi:NAD(P)-dependent dehydrogenase (short-subunit alcohol dehydrogenase family)
MDGTSGMTSAKPLENQVILVTGASNGLGRVAALVLAAAGATTVLIGRKIPRLENVYDEILASGGPQPAIYPLDLAGASEADYAEMAERIAAQLGRIDGVFHAAAELGALKPFGDIEGQSWQRLIHVNLSAPAFLTQALLPYLQASKSARIIFVDDAATGDGKAFWGAYGIAKAGLRALAKTLDAEMSSFGVQARMYAPGPIRTAIRLRAYPGERPDLLDFPESKGTEILALFTEASTPPQPT